ncbi:MAG: hypothetical protein ACRDQU_22630 [Pseudonocardiaceae bacterium]
MLGGAVLTAVSFSGAFVVSGVIGVLALLTMLRIPNDRFTAAPPIPRTQTGKPGSCAGRFST